MGHAPDVRRAAPVSPVAYSRPGRIANQSYMWNVVGSDAVRN